MNISAQDTPKIAGSNRTMTRIDANGHSPESQKAAVAARDTSDEKHPPKRLKSTVLRRSVLSGVGRTVEKTSASKIQEYECQDGIPNHELRLGPQRPDA
jgi:hypothetical protein